MARRGAAVGWVLALAVGAALGGDARGQARLNERARAPAGARAGDLRYRMLVTAEFSPQGAKILTVNPAGPGAWMRSAAGFRGTLEPGDVITAVDGKSVRGQVDYYEAMNAGGKGKKLTVKDKNTGKEVVWDVQAADVAPPAPPLPPNARRATGIKILVVADTDDGSIGKFVDVSLARLKEQLEQIPDVPPEKVQVRYLTGPQVTAKSVMDAVTALQAGPTETVVYYHLGHGAYDPKKAAGDPFGGHLFELPGGNVYRKPVWDALRAKKAQLTVMVTDTCNVALEAAAPSARRAAPIARTGESRPLAALLLDHAGEVNVSGSSKDQYGWFSERGGWWTDAVLTTLAAPAGFPDGATWDAFLKAAGDRCSDTYLTARDQFLKNPAGLKADLIASLRNQKDQRPQVYVKNLRPLR